MIKNEIEDHEQRVSKLVTNGCCPILIHTISLKLNTALSILTGLENCQQVVAFYAETSILERLSAGFMEYTK